MKRGIVFSIFILCIISISFLSPSILAEENNSIDLYFFYGKGCPHCSKTMDFLNDIKDNYPDLVIHSHETYFNEESRDLFLQMSIDCAKLHLM